MSEVEDLVMCMSAYMWPEDRMMKKTKRFSVLELTLAREGDSRALLKIKQCQ